MNNFIKALLFFILLVGYFTIFMIVGEWGMERQEAYECRKWQAEAIEFADKGYFFANWQVEQCNARQIPVSNMVK